MKRLVKLRPGWLVFLVSWLSFTISPLYAVKTFWTVMQENSGVEMQLESWLESCPSSGTVPITWKVTNHTNKDKKWSVDFTARNVYQSRYSINSTYSISVPAGQQREMVMYVPVGNGNDGSHYGFHMNLNLLVYGPGVSRGSDSLSSSGFSGNYTSFIGISVNAAGNSGWKDLKSKVKKQSPGKELRGSELDMSKAPEDWRGYSGVSQLWITESDWIDMGEVRKQALLDWLSMGGQLFVLVEDDTEAHVSTLKMPGVENDSIGTYRYAIGLVKIVKWNQKKLPVERVANLDASGFMNTENLISNYEINEDLHGALKQLQINTTLMFGFMVFFGLLVGPINLFWFAKAGKRSRLFWTTPVLSVAGSVILLFLMLVQDGTGGEGVRHVMMILQPQAKRISILQEQVSRTGVLTGRNFKKHEAMVLAPLRINGRTSTIKEVNLEEDEGAAGGGWFTSRSIQGQWLQTVRPSRAGIEFYPPSQGELDGAPEVVSTLGVTLAELWLVDANQNSWVVRDLGTGERKMLKKAEPSESMETFVQSLNQKRLGSSLDTVLKDIAMQPGHVVAIAQEVGDVPIKTLDSIQWNEQRLLVVGPYELKGRLP